MLLNSRQFKFLKNWSGLIHQEIKKISDGPESNEQFGPALIMDQDLVI